jgi:prevent-host-death family protein
MATKIGSTEARTVLGELLARVGYGGERFILERRGKPLAALISIEDLHWLESIEARETDSSPESVKDVTETYVMDQITESDTQLELRYTTDAQRPSSINLDAGNVFASLAGIWQHLSDDDIRQIDQTLLEMRHQTAKRLAASMQGASDG